MMHFFGDRNDDFIGEGGLPDWVLDERFVPIFIDGMDRDVLRRFGDTRTESGKGTADLFEVLWVKSEAMTLLAKL